MSDFQSPVRPGDRIADKYRVDGVLGAGGMGVVVAATHEHLDQKVAIKFLLAEVLQRPEVVARFIREARAAVKIRSEHVSRVLDVGTLPGGAPYMVMELLEGEDLEQLVERVGGLQWQQAVGYVLEACEALAEAHALGIVHRDIKPANLFLARGPGGTLVKVLDFGISKIPLTGKEQALTQETSIVGSPAYMSPEQVRASRDVDARSDVYSLGVVLYQLLTKNPPFTSTTMAGLVASVLMEKAPHLSLERPDVPPGLAAVIARCLEKDPASRFQDIVALSTALLPFGPPRAAQSLERIEHAMGRSSADRTIDFRIDNPSTDARPLSSTIAGAKGGSRRMWVVGFAAAVVAGLGVAGLFLRPGSGQVSTRHSGSDEVNEVPSAQASVAHAVSPADPSGSAAATVGATVSATATQAPSAVAPSVVPVLPEPSVTATPVVAPTAAPGPKTYVAPKASASAAAPVCRVVSFFDAQGNKHFKQECK